MKTKMFVLMSAVTLTFVASPLRADSADNDQMQRDRDAAHSPETTSLADLKRASQIIGMEIKDDQGRKQGRVKDLGFDLQNGRIAAVIVLTSDRLGTSERLAAVPPESLVCNGSSSMTLRSSGDVEHLRNAPDFQFTHWNELTANLPVLEMYQRFEAEPYFMHDDPTLVKKDVPGAQATQSYSFPNKKILPELGYVVRASKLMGTTAWNIGGEKLGRVNNFLVDVPTGRVVEVVLAYGGFLGMGYELSAVPPEVFRLNTDKSVLGLDTTPDALGDAPHFKSSNWNYPTQPEHITEVYAFYHVPASFITGGADYGALNVRARGGNSQSPIEQANLSDLEITAKIHQALLANENLSQDAKDIKVVTSDGKVTLVGPVASVKEKRIIAETAAKVVSTKNVDNQLEVHRPIISTPPAPLLGTP